MAANLKKEEFDMSTLTKEQKMNMVSQAIDKGFKIELVKYRANYDEAMSLLPIFEGLEIEYNHAGPETAWIWINQRTEYNDNFSATIHFK